MYTTVEEIARQCHEANRRYCEMTGDMSHKAWDESEEGQRKSIIQGVEYFLKDPSTTPEGQHNAWCEAKKADGWVFGETKDVEKKTHHCLVSYSELPAEQRIKDVLFQTVCRSLAPHLPHHTQALYLQLPVPLSEGEVLVDVFFNSGREDIKNIKQAFADVADYISSYVTISVDKMSNNSPSVQRANRLKARALSAIEDAAMYSVKAVTR